VGFRDHFSGHAAEYARFRPDYPDALFEYLGGLAPARRRAWDCATGNGQAAAALARVFDRVVATDASLRQLANTREDPRVRYAAAVAEASGLADGCVDAITVAQSLHWFERDLFWQEARRVLVQGGVLAFWAYGLFRMTPEIEEVVRRLYTDVVGKYWPAERGEIERGYDHIAFPFEEVRPPAFHMEKDWTLADLTGYLRTWSASRRYQAARGEDPVELVLADLARAWGGPPSAPRRASWPIQLRVGRSEGPLHH
jgi:SAM-dependent methyltransferase